MQGSSPKYLKFLRGHAIRNILQSDDKDKCTDENKTICGIILSKLIKIFWCDEKSIKGEHISNSDEKVE